MILDPRYDLPEGVTWCEPCRRYHAKGYRCDLGARVRSESVATPAKGSDRESRNAATIPASGLMSVDRPDVDSPAPGDLARSRAPSKPRRSHYSARRTTCERGHVHPSKVEARVCGVVFREAGELPVYLHPRIPCYCVGPDPNGLPCYVTPDFAVTSPSGLEYRRIVDAKSGRKRSPEWKRGRAMLERQLGVKVEEIDGSALSADQGRTTP